MIPLSQTTLLDIQAHARRCYPNEMVGIIMKSGVFKPRDNIATTDRTRSFEVAREDIMPVIKDIGYLIHSHTQPYGVHLSTPSIKDFELQALLGIPCLIIGCTGGLVGGLIQYPPPPRKKLVDRPYILGVNDCATILQDYYRFELGITVEIRGGVALSGRSNWRKNLEKVVMDNSFVRVEDGTPSRKGDVFVVQTPLDKHSHTVIFHNKTVVLHQGSVSRWESYGLWRNKIAERYRHESRL